MKLNKLFIALLVISSSVLCAGSFAGDFMSIGNGVTAAGLGGAFAAVANDASAIYWNSAGISQIRQTEFSIMRAFLYQNLAAYDNISICQPLPNEVTIGLNWTRLTIDDIPVFLEEHLVHNVDFRSAYLEFNLPGNPDRSIVSTDDLFQIAFSKHIHREVNLGWMFFDIPTDLHLGANAKFIKRKIDTFTGSGIGFDMSLLFKTSLAVLFEQDWLGQISFGMNIQDIGNSTISWNTPSSHTDEVPMNTKIGFAIEQPVPKIKSIFTISYDVDSVYDKVKHFGLSCDYNDFAVLRLGLNDSDFATGVSIKYNRFILDYAFITNVIANTNRLGLRYRF
jgi:hypothetical protein